MGPSTSVCNISYADPSNDYILLSLLKIGLAHVRRWGHQHGAAIDDTTRIYRYRTL